MQGYLMTACISGDDHQLAPSELEVAAGKLFLDWLAAEKAAAAAAEKLRLEQAEANVSLCSRSRACTIMAFAMHRCLALYVHMHDDHHCLAI